MAYAIVMPSLGMFTAEGSLAAWLKPTGAPVEAGEPIVEVTTEKTTQEIVAPTAGIVHQVADVGATLPIQALIGYVLAPGEAPPSNPSSVPPAASAAAAGAPPTAGAAGSSSTRVAASPIARRLAAEHGLDLSTIVGTGPGGRIVEADVAAAVAASASSASAEPSQAPTAAQAPARAIRERIPLVGMRRTIADRLRHSLSTAVPVTLVREAEVGQLVAARAALTDELQTVVAYDALFVRLLAVALARDPRLNAIIQDDAIMVLQDINIGFAVSVTGGLVVPVVEDANRRPFADLVDVMRQLRERALANWLRPTDVSTGTATITNLGAQGVDSFTPVLNPPQSAILGIGRIAKRPVVVEDRLEVRPTCTLSLTFDHRVVDGVPAGELLEDVARLMNDTAVVEVVRNGRW